MGYVYPLNLIPIKFLVYQYIPTFLAYVPVKSPLRPLSLIQLPSRMGPPIHWVKLPYFSG